VLRELGLLAEDLTEIIDALHPRATRMGEFSLIRPSSSFSRRRQQSKYGNVCISASLTPSRHGAIVRNVRPETESAES
jgi:hypothetical protein